MKWTVTQCKVMRQYIYKSLSFVFSLGFLFFPAVACGKMPHLHHTCENIGPCSYSAVCATGLSVFYIWWQPPQHRACWSRCRHFSAFLPRNILSLVYFRIITLAKEAMKHYKNTSFHIKLYYWQIGLIMKNENNCAEKSSLCYIKDF